MSDHDHPDCIQVVEVPQLGLAHPSDCRTHAVSQAENLLVSPGSGHHFAISEAPESAEWTEILVVMAKVTIVRPEADSPIRLSQRAHGKAWTDPVWQIYRRNTSRGPELLCLHELFKQNHLVFR